VSVAASNGAMARNACTVACSPASPVRADTQGGQQERVGLSQSW